MRVPLVSTARHTAAQQQVPPSRRSLLLQLLVAAVVAAIGLVKFQMRQQAAQYENFRVEKTQLDTEHSLSIRAPAAG